MLPFYTSWLNFPSIVSQVWVGLHLSGKWGLEILATCGESYFGYAIMLLWILFIFFRFGCMSILELVLKFRRRLMIFILDFSVGCPKTICQCPPSILWIFGVWWLTIWLLMVWVLPFLWGFWCLMVVFGAWLWFVCLFVFFFFNLFGFFCDFSNVSKSLG